MQNITEADNEMLKDRIKFLEEEIKILSERIIVRFDNGKCKCSQSVYEHIYKLEEENEKLKKGRDIMITNYEKIKAMSIEEMAKLFQQKQCEECSYQPDWEECKQLDCWVKGDTYINWLEQEAQDDN